MPRPELELQVDETGHTELAGKMFLLRRMEMFAHLDDSELLHVAALLRTRMVSEGETIVKQGALDQDVYVIKSGLVNVQAAGQKLATLGPGEIFGELAIIDPAPRSATVVAAEPGCVYRLPGESFLAVLEERPEIVEGIIALLCRRLRALQDGSCLR